MIKRFSFFFFHLVVIVPFVMGQQKDSTIFVDSVGQVFVKENAPIYFFIAPDVNPESRILIPNGNSNSPSPMYFKGNGTHFLRTNDALTNKPIEFKIIADGVGPKVSIRFISGLLMNSGKRYYVDEGAVANFIGKDNLSGVRSIHYSLDGATFSDSKHVVFDKGHDYLVDAYAIDNVGNVSDTIKFRVISAVNAIIKINNIYFDTNSARLKPESKKELDEFVQVLNEYPEIRIELRAHTDSRGDASYNLDLSQMRAESVVNYLVACGVNSDRLTFKGFGDTSPINECSKGVTCSDEKHQENRRVEFKILPMK